MLDAVNLYLSCVDSLMPTVCEFLRFHKSRLPFLLGYLPNECQEIVNSSVRVLHVND